MRTAGFFGMAFLSWSNGGLVVGSAGVKRRERWRSCFLVLVVVGGNSVEWSLERRAAVRSFAAAMMVSSGVADGILKLCGNHFTVCAILVRPVDGTQMLWQQ